MSEKAAKERWFFPVILISVWGDFIGNLSVFDLLFNCGPKSKEILRESLSQ